MGWLGNVVVKTIINGAALYLAAAIVPGIHLGEEGSAGKTFGTILIGLIILNELRGLAVVSLIVTSWLHGGTTLAADLP